MIGFIPKESPLKINYIEVLEVLGMHRLELNSDAKYTNTRIDCLAIENKKAADNAFAFKLFQVLSKLLPYIFTLNITLIIYKYYISC